MSVKLISLIVSSIQKIFLYGIWLEFKIKICASIVKEVKLSDKAIIYNINHNAYNIWYITIGVYCIRYMDALSQTNRSKCIALRASLLTANYCVPVSDK